MANQARVYDGSSFGAEEGIASNIPSVDQDCSNTKRPGMTNKEIRPCPPEYENDHGCRHAIGSSTCQKGSKELHACNHGRARSRSYGADVDVSGNGYLRQGVIEPSSLHGPLLSVKERLDRRTGDVRYGIIVIFAFECFDFKQALIDPTTHSTRWISFARPGSLRLECTRTCLTNFGNSFTIFSKT